MGMGRRLGLAHYGLNWRKLFPLSFPFFFSYLKVPEVQGSRLSRGLSLEFSLFFHVVLSLPCKTCIRLASGWFLWDVVLAVALRL